MYYVQEVTSRTRLAMIHIYMWDGGLRAGSGKSTKYLYIYFFGGGQHLKETAAATEG